MSVLWVLKVAISLIFINFVTPMDEKEREKYATLKVKKPVQSEVVAEDAQGNGSSDPKPK